MSKIRTIYNPGVGIVYIIENTKTGEMIKVSTLTTRDADQKPCRSPMGTPEGREFFKVKSGSKKNGFTYYKFMNSIKCQTCLSEDGLWRFTGMKPDGVAIPKITDILKKERIAGPALDSGSNTIKATIEKIDSAPAMPFDIIKEKIEAISVDDFSATDLLQELLLHKENV